MHLNRAYFIKSLNFLMIVASLILIISISFDIFLHDPLAKDSLYFDIQFWICIFFTFNFFIFLLLSDNKFRFILQYSIIFFLSIPYLAILDYSSIQLTEEQAYLVSSIPLFRGGIALVMLILLVVKRNITALFLSYNLLLFSIIYFLSLIFFIFEKHVNIEVKSFGDALWWAGMTVTTLGSNIVPITNVGKIATTVLAATGMTAFPIFTVYLTSLLNTWIKSEKEHS